MLEAIYLTKSKVRRRLFGLLFSSPKKTYYLSELARLIGTSPGNVQRELIPFIRDRLIRREKRGNLTLYPVNPSHALYPELRSLILKTSGVEARLRELVNGKPEIQLAILYGSFAKDAEKGESDIDLLLVADQETGRFYKEISHLESFFGREINPTIYSSQEFKKKLTQKDGFVAHLLKEPYRVLKGDLHDYRAGRSRRT